ncbi:MAG: hypothetical protein COT34_00595 [Candidatus Nealsonbacteria bacterium CG08_land_8_20_14_0_20_43_11]|uniref:DUF4349 domain-containing protein n=1 Tax=Candidatus Nealsonbacteria bacterium CG08_land_8_20_14_0_20_43_11 TaxID=1974706 RepID=A0A2M6T157_9BACT|nr:MAG: hypothetical protein COT34_00595 [Candidatus Nealsonbacteria bacterium CG08_land_8_20_14_0_20_43_11]
MAKKILIALGIVIVGLVALSIILTSLSGARQRADIGLQAPLTTEKQAGEVKQITPEGTSRLVIRTGTINIVVKNITDSVKSIVQYTENKGGWIVLSGVTEQKEIPSGSVTVRVPAEIFDEAMVYFKGLAEKVSYEGTQGQDVTEEYTDLQSQLRNLEATESQLLKIMERSGTITEVLAVQRELTTIRGQIEQTKGRIQYLETSARMATISINLALSEELLPIPPAEKWRPVYIIKQAWRNLLGSLRGISYFLIWIGIYAIIWVPLGIVVWQARKFWKRRKEIKKI